MRSSVSLFKKHLKTGPVWYARFLNPATQEYEVTRSTGVPVQGKGGRKLEAHLKAQEIAEGITFDTQGFFIPFLLDFWREDSTYARMKRIVEKSPLSLDYIASNVSAVKTIIKPYPPFQKIRIDELSPAMIEDWKLWALEQGKGPRRVNAALQAMGVPLRYALSREELKADPLRGVKKVPETPKEKGVLTQAEIGNLINVQEQNPIVKTAVLLAALAGLRRGEARGLQWADVDIKKGTIEVRHNYVDSEGLKPCKWGSGRTVFLPSPIVPLLEELKSLNPYKDPGPDDFILFNLKTRKEPVTNDILRRGFKRVMKSIGIDTDQQKRRNLTFHGLRHTFVTLARMAGIPDIAVQSLAGHASAKMMDRYSHGGQVVDFAKARKQMERAHQSSRKAK
jgi:integrase